jgi:putative NIF3 family GTP cyclohydrolase 1 type 2
VDLDQVVGALDELFDLATAEPDASMSRHVPRVFDEAGIDWRAFVEPLYAQRFNGLVRRGRPEVGTVYGASFPSADVLDAWLAVAGPGDLLVTHHPIDARNGSPEGDVWGQGFVPIAPAHLGAIAGRGLSLYACHAPMDASLVVGTAAAIVEALDGTTVDHFWPYGGGHAGHVADIPPTSSAGLVDRARAIFGVSTVEVEGAAHDSLSTIAVLPGVGDRVDQMTLAEGLGASSTAAMIDTTVHIL